MSGDASTLAAELAASRARSTRLTEDLRGERLLGPKLPIVNPPLWELGHLAWFQEFWCLRHRDGAALGDSILPEADALFDSAKVAHATRWNLPLPSLEATRRYQADVLGLVLRRLEMEPENADLLYFADLAAFHEDMHAEAFHYTRQTLGYEDPFGEHKHGGNPHRGHAKTSRSTAVPCFLAPQRIRDSYSTTKNGRTRCRSLHSGSRAPQ